MKAVSGKFIITLNDLTMNAADNLNRFLEAQQKTYAGALEEMERGKKQGHWIWYIFPQISGLGFSETAQSYAIKDLNEAAAFLRHPVLGSRLIAISQALLSVKGKTAHQILGHPDDLKVRSCMTLFSLVQQTDSVFQAVLDKLYGGIQDSGTLGILKR